MMGTVHSLRSYRVYNTAPPTQPLIPQVLSMCFPHCQNMLPNLRFLAHSHSTVRSQIHHPSWPVQHTQVYARPPAELISWHCSPFHSICSLLTPYLFFPTLDSQRPWLEPAIRPTHSTCSTNYINGRLRTGMFGQRKILYILLPIIPLPKVTEPLC